MRSLILTLLLCLPIFAWASSGERHALLIGNANYTVGKLKNPTNDAKALANTLRKLGFEVTLLENVDRRQMREGIKQYSKSLKAGDVNLFYYAGHGVQHENTNYLIPLKADIETTSDIEYESIDLGFVLDTFKQAKNRQNIVLLDACRNNPYRADSRGLKRGLAQTEGPRGTFIAYATAPGAVALDGKGSHGVFTGALLSVIEQEGLTLEQVFKQTLAKVNAQTNGGQVPWISSSFYEDFYFSSKPVASAEQKPATVVKQAKKTETALTIRSNIYHDDVVIDGKSYGPTPLSLNLPNGTYHISVTRNGFKTWQQSVQLKGGDRTIWAQMQRNIKLIKYKNGDRFVGKLVNGKKSGKGLYVYSSTGPNSGSRFYGEYSQGLRHGFGTYIAGNGERFTGEFQNGKRHGTGTLNFTNGDQYYGDFVNGERTGKGSVLYRRGDSYYGEFVSGKRHGFGLYTFANGNQYEGPFVDGKRHGMASCSTAAQAPTPCYYQNDKIQPLN